MNTDNESGRSAASEKDIRKSEKDLGPHTDVRPDKFPDSKMHKDQRRDAERLRTEDDDEEKQGAELEELADDVDGTVGSRATGRSPEDIAGVADLDQGMRRSRRNKGS